MEAGKLLEITEIPFGVTYPKRAPRAFDKVAAAAGVSRRWVPGGARAVPLLKRLSA